MRSLVLVKAELILRTLMQKLKLLVVQGVKSIVICSLCYFELFRTASPVEGDVSITVIQTDEELALWKSTKF